MRIKYVHTKLVLVSTSKDTLYEWLFSSSSHEHLKYSYMQLERVLLGSSIRWLHSTFQFKVWELTSLELILWLITHKNKCKQFFVYDCVYLIHSTSILSYFILSAYQNLYIIKKIFQQTSLNYCKIAMKKKLGKKVIL